MSRPLSLSSAFCAFAMALFVLTARAGVSVDASSATTEIAAPLVWFQTSN